MDAFYVSVELQRRPELRGKPVVVAGSSPRAVVTTASYEARRFGIFSATPAERARRLCPDAIFIPPDFESYRARSREVMAVLRAHVERVEVVGLDEAYLDLSGFERHRAAARRIKAAVTERTGLGCSIGIGPSKLVAKVASDAEKPDGFVELTAEQARERFAGSPPGLVPGIGPKTAQRLERQGIATLGRLAETPDEPARRMVRRAARPVSRAPRALRGRSPHRDRAHRQVRVARDHLRPRPARASASSSPTCAGSPSSFARPWSSSDRCGRTIGIKVRYDDFSIVTRARSLPAPVSDLDTIWEVAIDLLRRLEPPRPVRLIGVRVAGLDEQAEPVAPGGSAQPVALVRVR